MIETIVPLVRAGHIAIGTLGLLLFWIPILTRKGGSTHVRFGRAFAWVCYAVLASATLSVLLHMFQFWRDGIGPRQAPAAFSLYVFLGYLTITTFAIITHGRGAAVAKENSRALRTPWRVALMVLTIASSLGLIAYALHFRPPTFWVLLAISSFGLFAGYDGLAHMARPRATTREWVYQHLNGMIGAGIAFYTAFGAFGARILFDFNTLGASWLNVIPWLLPAAIGIPATLYWKRLVMRRFQGHDMSLPHILLGLLAKPTSGYDLHKEFESSLAHFWSANLSQIYPTLNRMEADGLVASNASASSLGPARRLYRRTPEGERALIAWIASGPQILNVRRHYLAQVYFLGAVESAEAARAFFAKLLDTLLARQAALEAIQHAWRGERSEDFCESLGDDEFYPYMALELGLEANRTRIAWCRRCLARIEKVKLAG